MRRLLEKIPIHVSVILKRMGISLLMLYITRLIFLAFNSGSFQELEFWDYTISIWFDLITIGLFFLPFYSIYLLPIPIRGYKTHRILTKTLWHSTNTLLIAFNLLDVEYFKYTSKRSTFDLFSMLSTGSDLKQLISTFLKDFWFLVLILIILVVLSEWLYRKTEKSLATFKTKTITFYRTNLIAFVVLTPILIIMGRGGFTLKPTGIIEASNYCKTENTAFVLTTPFTMIKTINQGGLNNVDYYSEVELLQIFNPIKQSIPQHILPDGTNVVMIMLESFGIEFIGAYNSGEGYTPFLDSLIGHSLTFNYAFANGKKSIEAVPAAIASIPTLMDNPYISSPYGNNKLNSLPNILKKYGYSSGFFHGATNGSMRFDGFSKICGFDNYYGRHEYNNDDHFDKTWGILDEYFNPWTAKKLTEMKEPFFGFLFTVSSHHPYFIPEHMKPKVKKGPQPICGSINYSDYALSEFFKEAKKQPWYDNTLFVLLADHTPGSKTPEYQTRTHLYRIPIVFYHPNGSIKPEKSNKIIQQLDLLPTILDLLNIKTKYYAFGNSQFQSHESEALTYIGGTYYYYKNSKMTSFSNDKARNLYDFTNQSVAPTDSISYYSSEVEKNEKRIKSIIQTYSRDLILNQTTVDEKEDQIYN
ncbi:MAG: LTA synthase family protein [Crocinitomicaceae bacterium]